MADLTSEQRRQLRLDPKLRDLEGFVNARVDPLSVKTEPMPTMVRIVMIPGPGYEPIDYVAELDDVQANPEVHAARIIAGIKGCRSRGLLTLKGEKRRAYYDDPA